MEGGTPGRVAGWGLNEDNVPSPQLKVIDLHAVDYRTCKREADPSFAQYILNDKFCASRAKANVCQGDSGGGFLWPKPVDAGVTKYFLRGLVSVGPNAAECKPNGAFLAFTDIVYYERIVLKYTQV